MSLKVCPIQEICQKYENGTKHKGHLVRLTNPCKAFLDMSCEMSIEIQLFLGETLACKIDKHSAIIEKIKKGG